MKNNVRLRRITVAVVLLTCWSLASHMGAFRGDDGHGRPAGTIVGDTIASSTQQRYRRVLQSGKDFDARVVDHVVHRFRRKTGRTIEPNSRGLHRLRLGIERAISTLSSHPTAHIDIENVVDGVDLNTILTRALFEELTKDLMSDALEAITRVLMEAQLDKADIDEIVLVGEYSRIPKLQHLLKQFLLGKEPMQGIKPEQVVATGAAIQGHWLTDADKEDMLICFQVAPLSIGVETVGGVMHKLLLRNTVIPTKKHRVFSVARTADCNTCCGVNVRVFEGERALVKHNKLLATLRVESDRCHSHSSPQIEVTLEIECDETLTVTVVDQATLDKATVRLPRDGYATQDPEEIEVIFQESERYAEEDQRSLDALTVVDEIE